MSCSPVINGCAGKCCERFTMPFSLEELKRNNEAVTRGDSEFLSDSGIMKRALNDNTRDMVLDMLIPLGYEIYDPQTPFVTFVEAAKWALCIPDDEPLTKADFQRAKRYTGGDLEWERFCEDGEMRIHHYTCKHFDTEKRICNTYETRPNMCHHFGRGCHYEGCGFTALLQIEAEKERVKHEFQMLLYRIKNYEFDDEPFTDAQKKEHEWDFLLSPGQNSTQITGKAL